MSVITIGAAAVPLALIVPPRAIIKAVASLKRPERALTSVPASMFRVAPSIITTFPPMI